MRIAQGLKAYAAVAVVGLIASVGVASTALQTLRIGSEAYQHIVDGKDFTADIMPPPLYVIEAYLEAKLIADRPNERATRTAHLTELKTAFFDRLKTWKASSLPAPIKDVLLQDVLHEAEHFWQVLDEEFLPTLQRQDQAQTAALSAKLHAAFEAHRAGVDKAVALATDFETRAEQEADRESQVWTRVTFALAGGLLVLLLLGTAILLRRVVRPISGMTAYMHALTQGRYDEVPYRTNRDEIGEMATSVEVFRQSLLDGLDARRREAENRQRAEQARAADDTARRHSEEERQAVIADLAAGLRSLSEGDLTFRLQRAFPPAYEQLKSDFNDAIATMAETIGQVAQMTLGVDGGAREMTSASEDLSRRTERQAASLEEASASLHQITATIRHTAEHSSAAKAAASQARSGALASLDVVQQAVSAIQRIAVSSAAVSQTVSVIDEMAFQTNLLALNAGVEAARAGEAGRGFAVVAQEVRELAQRSGQAAREIRDLIKVSVQDVEAGVAMSQQTSQSLQTIVEQVKGLVSFVETVAHASSEQSAAIDGVNTSVSDMDQVTQQNAAMVEEVTAACRTLATLGSDLAALMCRFRLVESAGLRQVA